MNYLEIGLSQKCYEYAKTRIPAGTQLLSKRPEMFLPDYWPAYFSKAKGCECWDLDGRHYYDLTTNGIGACLLGFADQDVSEAVIRRIQDGSMCTLNPSEEVELADIQWFLWLLGKKIKSVIATSSKLSNLDFVKGSPDTLNAILEFEDGMQFNWHFNGVNKACDHGVWIAGNETTVMWDLHSPKSRIFDVKKNAWVESGPNEFEYEQAYVREIKHFMSQLDSGSVDWPVNLEDGIQMAKLIAAVNKSILNDGMKVRL